MIIAESYDCLYIQSLSKPEETMATVYILETSSSNNDDSSLVCFNGQLIPGDLQHLDFNFFLAILQAIRNMILKQCCMNPAIVQS